VLLVEKSRFECWNGSQQKKQNKKALAVRKHRQSERPDQGSQVMTNRNQARRNRTKTAANSQRQKEQHPLSKTERAAIKLQLTAVEVKLGSAQFGAAARFLLATRAGDALSHQVESLTDRERLQFVHWAIAQQRGRRVPKRRESKALTELKAAFLQLDDRNRFTVFHHAAYVPFKRLLDTYNAAGSTTAAPR